MKQSLLIFLIILAGISASLIIFQKKTVQTIPVGQVATYTSTNLQISFQFPSTWTIDTSQESQGLVAIQSGQLDLNAIQSIAYFRINAARKNQQLLDPKSWFSQIVAPNVDPPVSSTVTTVNGLPAYTITTNEMSMLRHTFVFKGIRVIEMYYPTDQPRFSDLYETIAHSLTIN